MMTDRFNKLLTKCDTWDEIILEAEAEDAQRLENTLHCPAPYVSEVLPKIPKKSWGHKVHSGNIIDILETQSNLEILMNS